MEQDKRQFICVCWFAFIADSATELFPSSSGSSVSLEDQEGEPWPRIGESANHPSLSLFSFISLYNQIFRQECHFMIFFISDHWYSFTRQVYSWSPDIIPSVPQSPWLYPERYASHWEIWDFQNSPRILDGSSGLCSNEIQHHLATPYNSIVFQYPVTTQFSKKSQPDFYYCRRAYFKDSLPATESNLFQPNKHQTRYDNKRKRGEEFNEGVNMPGINLFPTSPALPRQGSMVVLVSRRISVWSEIHEIGISLGAIDSAHLYIR